jgi:hypothetical protein
MTAVGARVLAVDNVGAPHRVIVRIGFPRCRESHILKFGEQEPLTGFTPTVTLIWFTTRILT